MRYADLRWSYRLAPAARHLPVNIACLCVAGMMASGCAMLETKKPTAAAAAPLVDDKLASAPESAQPLPQSSDAAQPSAPKARKSVHKQTVRGRARTMQTASIDPNRLIGLDMDGVRRILGQPASEHDGNVSREWRYAMPGCSFHIFFYPNLKGATFLALKYTFKDKDGDVADPSDVCARRILTARSNGTG